MLSAGFTSIQAQSIMLSSPSGNIKMDVENTSRLTYRISRNGKTIVATSPMGFKFKNEADMGLDLELIDQKEVEFNETWAPVVRSKHASVTDHYKSLSLKFVEKSGAKRRLDVEFRAYNDGIAFRYQLFPIGEVRDREILKELTEFHIEGNPKAWVADYKKYVGPQEQEFWPNLLNEVPNTALAGLPFLIEIDKKNYAAITEAKISNYPGFYIGVNKRSSPAEVIRLATKLAPLPYESEEGVKARFAQPQYTPWRVVMLGSSPGSLIESEIIQNLNDPCVLKDVSWIKPGISAWDHWWSGEVKQDMPTIKQYIDLASAQGWPYMVVDWQWYGKFNHPDADITKTAPQLDMPELLCYAKEKNVRLWLWLYSSDVNRNNQYKEAFALYEKWGVAGIKIDFMDRDDQEMVNWYKRIIECAAEHHLMVDMHGAYKPDGIIRTYPNMITREGVMGEENTKWSTRLTSQHNVTLAFTRMLAGQMDYTPGGFLNVTKANFVPNKLPATVMNTRCAELAKFVIYESPFTVYCDHPDHILNQPGADFLKIVPTTWDDIHVLSGYPDEHIVMMKKTGDRFFLGGMTNSNSRTVKVKLDFLPAGQYELTSWVDAADADREPRKLVKAKKLVNSKSSVSFKMAVNGGFVAEIKAIK